MNQNTQDQRQRMQQNSQQQAMQFQQMSQEELQKTQVLNLQDVEEAARFERMTSKKPALIVAIIGVLSIFFGTTFGVVQSLTEKPVQEESKKGSTAEQRQSINEETLNCTLTQLNNADGTDQIYNVVYTFADNKLVSFVRNASIEPTPGNASSAAAIEWYKQAMQSYLVSLNGYQVAVSPTTSGLLVTTTVDYTKLDLSTFPETQQATTYTIVEYVANTDKTSIQTDMLTKGYTCQ